MGKCPYCQQRCYIPTAPDEVGEIPVPRVDPQEQGKARALKRESPAVGGAAPQQPQARPSPSPEPSSQGEGEEDLTTLVQEYILHMVKGDLAAAEALTRKISKWGSAAVKVIDDLAMTGFLHPGLEGVPPGVVSGFFRQLRKDVLGQGAEGE